MIIAAREDKLKSERSGIRTLGAVPAVLGFASIAGQIVLMRELLVLFNGSEMSLGLMLAAWLLWTSAGAALGSIATRRVRGIARVCAATSFLCGISTPVTLWLLRGARHLFTPIPTELLGPAPMMLVCGLYLAMFCALSGASFATAARLIAQRRKTPGSTALAYAYALETAGAAAGGAATSLLLVFSPAPMQLAMTVCGLYCCAAAMTFAKPRWRSAGIALAVAAAVPAVFWIAPRMESASQQRLWAEWNVVRAVESRYGRITVTNAGGMRSIYVDGAIVTNVPDPAAAEESVHFALLEHARPRTVLLIGGTLNGSIAQVLQYRTVERVDAVELEPALVTTFRDEFPSKYAQNFSDARVHVSTGDARRLLQTAEERWDAIVVQAPEPQTAQWNRFYTEEFFQLARRRLEPGGVLAIEARSSEEFISPQRAAFVRSVYRTLKQEFAHVAVIPGDPVHMIASREQGALTEEPQELVSRLRSRGVRTQYVSEFILPYRMSAERVSGMRALLDAPEKTPINRDFRPLAYYFSTVLWHAQFSRGYAGLLERFARVPFSVVLAIAVALLGIVLLGCAWGGRRKAAGGAAAWSVLAGGYSLMTLQVLLLFSFQSLLGYVYSALALVMGMFMGGIALGTWLGARAVRSAGGDRLLRLSILAQALAIAAPLLLMCCVAVVSRSRPVWVAPAMFALLALVCGVPGGLQFPIAVELFGKATESRGNPVRMYVLDLVGGCVGAVLVAGFLVPLFGFWSTASTVVVVGVPGIGLGVRAVLSRGN